MTNDIIIEFELVIKEKKPKVDRWIFNFPRDFRHFCTLCKKSFKSSEMYTHIMVCK